MARRNGKLSEGESIALIHDYGVKIAGARGGIGGVTRLDVIEWAERIAQLARGLPSKNSLYLRDDDHQ